MWWAWKEFHGKGVQWEVVESSFVLRSVWRVWRSLRGLLFLEYALSVFLEAHSQLANGAATGVD